MAERTRIPSSFRDPAGYIFEENGVLFRQINSSYKTHYLAAEESGLFSELIRSGLLIAHEDIQTTESDNEPVFKTIKPERVPFVSYPYEWSFSQLKEAALLTLEIQKKCLEKGMCLKDASAYNIQFIGSSPRFIDTLSFEIYREGEPWIAYRQFCQHFLAPLSLMYYRDPGLARLMLCEIDGIPLETASRLLPFSSWLNPYLSMHIHAHAKSMEAGKRKEAAEKIAGRSLSKAALSGIIESLDSLIRGFKPKDRQTDWSRYYEEHNYSDTDFKEKSKLVETFIMENASRRLLDLGANTGFFSRLSSSKSIFTISTDMDCLAVERNYLKAREENDEYLLPLVIDLRSPSPALGWANTERESFSQRASVDLVMALALIHHLVIGNNVPLSSVAEFLAGFGPLLIIEFVPKSDKQVEEMLRTRVDIFPDYNETGFESAFEKFYTIEKKAKIGNSGRLLYLLKTNK